MSLAVGFSKYSKAIFLGKIYYFNLFVLNLIIFAIILNIIFPDLFKFKDLDYSVLLYIIFNLYQNFILNLLLVVQNLEISKCKFAMILSWN